MLDNSAEDVVEGEAFGHTFYDLRGLIEDIKTLESEGAIYSHFWDDSIKTFRYYRIKFLPSEIFQYVESQVAKQQFDNALTEGASFDEALQAIKNPDIRERVRSYRNYGHTKLANGTEVDIRGCAASFWPPEMEALVCGQRPDRYELLPEIASDDKLAFLFNTIDCFPVIRRFLADRKHNRPPFRIENEYDTQDLLYTVLRGIFTDVIMEEWTPKHAGGSKRIDIVIPSIDTVIEVKQVRDLEHAKSISDELRIDIESYHAHPHCKTFVAFVHDPDQYIVDHEPLMRDLSGRRVIGDNEFDVHVLVRA